MAPVFLTLTLLATVSVPPCPTSVSLEESLTHVERLPVVEGYGSASRARSAFGDRVGWLHGQTSVQLNPGVRWFPLDQLRPEGSIGLQHSAVLADLGGARRRINQAEALVLTTRADAERVQRRLTVAVQWVHRWSAQAGVALAQQQLDAAKELEQKLIAARALNASSQAELLWARTGRQRRQLELIDAEGQASEAGLALAAAIGCAEPAVLAVAGNPWPPADAPTTPPATSVAAAALSAQLAALTDRQALAALEQRPTVNVGLSTEVDGANTARTLLGVGGSWSLFEGDYLARGQQAAERELLKAQLDQTSLSQEHLFAALAHELEHQQEALALLEGELLPDAHALEAVTQTAFEAGEATAADLVVAKAASVEAERSRLAARELLALAVVRARIWSALPEAGATKTAGVTP
jgi:outer membrane protein TolC